MRTYGGAQPVRRPHAASDFPGNGAGLAAVRQLAGLHGGRVGTEGAAGAGATFYFTLDDKDGA